MRRNKKLPAVSLSHRRTLLRRIQNAWIARFDQDLALARRETLAIRRELGDPSSIAYVSADDLDLGAELFLLEASIARADRRLPHAQTLIQQVERELRRWNRPLPASYHQQLGLNFISESEYSAALEQFLAANVAAETPREKFWALGNALVCIENLGLPFGHTLGEFERLAAELDLGEGNRSHVACLRARRAFRHGDFDGIEETPRFKTIQQIHYYRLWIDSLPWNGAAAPAARRMRELEEFVLRGRSLYLHAYRARTLQSLWHADDAAVARWNEIAHRLYLWTWRWLADPDTYSFALLEPLLAQIAAGGALFGKLTTEDFQLIRNALAWIAFFDRDAEAPLERWLSAHRPAYGEDFPVYALEYALVRKLTEAKLRRRVFDPTDLRLLSIHPLWPSSAVGIPALARAVSGEKAELLPALRGIAQRISRRLTDDAPSSSALIRVDLLTSEVAFADPRRNPIISAPIARALALLSKRSAVSYAEFVRICFGFYRYDPVIHDLKVLNLLARIRAFLPRDSHVGVKSGAVHAHFGGDFIHVALKQPHLELLRESEAWKRLLSPAAPSARAAAAARPHADAKQLLKRFAGRVDVTRRELEDWTGKSRATSNRWINQWIEQGILERRGFARDTRYRIVSPGETA